MEMGFHIQYYSFYVPIWHHLHDDDDDDDDEDLCFSKIC